MLGNPLTIIMDNKALTFVHKFQLNNSRITRWILGIQEYDFEIIHYSGKDRRRHTQQTPGGVRRTHHAFDHRDELEINTIKIKLKLEVKRRVLHIGKHQQEDNSLKDIIDTIKQPKDTEFHDRYI